ncbi:MAG: Calx-beta domain-containing protein [Bacteroidota bacterium]
MKNFLRPWLLLAIVPLIFVSCDDDESEVVASSQTIALLSTSNSVVEGESAPFSVIFLGQPEQQTSDITVNYTITGGADGTLTASVTIPAGEQSAEFNVSIPEDNDLEADTTDLLLQLTDASGGFAINENFPQNRKEFILLEDTKNISVSNDTTNISETFSSAGDTLFLPINISNSLDGQVTLDYALSGTAVPGADYMLASDNPLVIAAGATSAQVGVIVLDDLDAEAGGKSLYIELESITLADTDDEETTLSAGDANRVVAYNFTDDTKTFGFDIAPADTIVITSEGTVSATITKSGDALNGTTLSFTDNLPVGVSLNATSSDVSFSPSETSRVLEFTIDANAFTGTDVTGTYVISGIDSDGDDEAIISATNNTIVFKIVND